MKKAPNQPSILDFLKRSQDQEPEEQPPKRQKIEESSPDLVNVTHKEPEFSSSPSPPGPLEPAEPMPVPNKPAVAVKTTFNDPFFTKHVFLPHHPSNVFFEIETGLYHPRWQLILVLLSTQPIPDSSKLEVRSPSQKTVIMSYNMEWVGAWDFRGLHCFFKDYASDRERARFFDETLPHIVSLALRVGELNQKLPLLRQSMAFSLNLTQTEISILLANAFLCTFPYRNNPNALYKNYPTINFWGLFEATKGMCTPKQAGKLRCLFHYFHRIRGRPNADSTIISFRRQVCDNQPDFASSNRPLSQLFPQVEGLGLSPQGQSKMPEITSTSTSQTSLWAVGCCTLGLFRRRSGSPSGRSSTDYSPELIVARLFSEKLRDNESIIITGVERYSDYTGYATTFTWAGDHR